MQRFDLINIIVIVLVGLIGMKDLMEPGLFTAHDIWHQVARFYHYQQAVIEGQFPAYWIANMAHDYGYPLFFFSYPLPWLVGLPILALGVDLASALKILFTLPFIASGLSMYWLVFKLFNNRVSGLVAAVAYLWMPYHFLSVYVAAQIGTVFVYFFLPVLFLGLYKLVADETKRQGILLTSIALSGVVLSHLMSLFFLIPTLAIFSFYLLIWSSQKKAKLRLVQNIVLSTVTAVLVSSFYLVPAIFYSSQTNVRSDPGFSRLYLTNFVNLSQLIYSKWGYSPIISNAKDGEISFALGIAQWIGVVLCSLGLIFHKFDQSRRLIITLLIILLVNVFLITDYSKGIWFLVERVITLDYPFRLMVPLSFVASILVGGALLALSPKVRPILAILLIGVALYTNRNHIKVNLHTDISIKTYVDSELTTNTFNEYLPVGLRGVPEDLSLINPELPVSHVNLNTRQLDFQVEASQAGMVSVRQFKFPGITTFVDNTKVETSADDLGRVRFQLPTGHSYVKVRFEETPLIIVGKILSLAGLIVLIGLINPFNLLKYRKLLRF